MATLVVTPGVTLNGNYTINELNLLGQPTVALSGALGTSDLAAGAVTPEKTTPGAYFYAAGTLGGGVYVITLSPAATAYAAGLQVNFKADAINTGAVDLNVNSLGAKNLFKDGTSELAAGDIRAGQLVSARYDGTNFQMETPWGNSITDYELDTGAANALVISPQRAGVNAYTAYSQMTGKLVMVKVAAANTTAATLNVNGLGAKSILKGGGQALIAGDLVANRNALLYYDAVNDRFETINPTYAPAVAYVGADAGAVDDYAVTPVPAPLAYSIGMVVVFKANTANTGAATLNVNGLGAKTVKKNVSATLATNDILAGQWVVVVYDGTNFQLQNSTGKLTSEYSGTDSVTVPTSNGYRQFEHLLGVTPKSFSAVIRCIDAGGDIGYAENEEVPIGAMEGQGTPDLGASASADSVYVTISYHDVNPFRIQHKTTGAIGSAVNAKWRYKVYAWA